MSCVACGDLPGVRYEIIPRRASKPGRLTRPLRLKKSARPPEAPGRHGLQLLLVGVLISKVRQQRLSGAMEACAKSSVSPSSALEAVLTLGRSPVSVRHHQGAGFRPVAPPPRAALPAVHVPVIEDRPGAVNRAAGRQRGAGLVASGHWPSPRLRAPHREPRPGPYGHHFLGWPGPYWDHGLSARAGLTTAGGSSPPPA